MFDSDYGVQRFVIQSARGGGCQKRGQGMRRNTVPWLERFFVYDVSIHANCGTILMNACFNKTTIGYYFWADAIPLTYALMRVALSADQILYLQKRFSSIIWHHPIRIKWSLRKLMNKLSFFCFTKEMVSYDTGNILAQRCCRVWLLWECNSLEEWQTV